MSLELDSRGSGSLRRAFLEWAKEGEPDEPEEPKPRELPDPDYSLLDSIPARPHPRYTGTTIVKLGKDPYDENKEWSIPYPSQNKKEEPQENPQSPNLSRSVPRQGSLRAMASATLDLSGVDKDKRMESMLVFLGHRKKSTEGQSTLEGKKNLSDSPSDPCDHAVCSKYCQGCRHKLFHIKPTPFALQEKPKTCVRCRSVFFSDMRVCVECAAARADQPPSQNATKYCIDLELFEKK